MTQRPSDRAAQTLRDLGLTAAPLSALEREDALFILTPETLLYQDAGGTRRVTLRDLTRIHSDQEGTLRVETPAGTALSASLLGFDPGAVQTFFGGVRDATARAKEQPASPLPQSGAPKTFAPPASAPATAARPAPVSSTPAAPTPERAAPEPEPQVLQSPVHVEPPAPAVQERPAPTPVVISSSAFSPTRPAEPKGPEVQRPAELRPAAAAPVGTAAAPAPVALSSAAPTLSTPAPAAPAPSVPALRGSAGAAAALARQADLAAGLPGRLRVLGVVLFLGAVILAIFQFTGGERLAGLWTLLAGGVGTVALVGLADIARLLISLALAAGEGSGVMDVD
ncbi:hypothetical protein [Deinococcus radiotolerans]|uniref:Uncharacterized protein n=1 Tax=Deinococcus radiotolerans TaxID=1309407 RepID=A0ABQ2FKT6_9DEIO|nr:hypothetical protein [Deinococcus radiotolerans]GGK97867.1 hypothetical protein GCM10010844_15170 [Deinococcus radiotolerans]